MFGRLNDFRRIATRYDKLARNFALRYCFGRCCAYVGPLSLEPS